MKLRVVTAGIIVTALCMGLLIANKQDSNEGAKENIAASAVDAGAEESNEGALDADASGSGEPIKHVSLTPDYGVKVTRDLVYASKQNGGDAAEPLELDLYEPTSDGGSRGPRPVLIFIHGGGYSSGSKHDAIDFSTEMAKRGYVVLAVNYRLKERPFIDFQHTLNDAYEDIADAIRWIGSNAEAHRLDAGRIAIGGDSAGGHLSMNFVNAYLERDPALAAPIFAIIDMYGGRLDSSPHEKLPPVLIMHGTNDQLIPYEQSLQLKDSLQASGIYHNMLTLHGVGHDYKTTQYFGIEVDTTAHFLWNVINRPAVSLLPESSHMEAVSGDAIHIPLPEAYRIGSEGEQRVNVTLPEGWQMVSEPGDTVGSDSKPFVQIQVPSGLDRGSHSVLFSLEDKGAMAASFAVNVIAGHPIDPSSSSLIRTRR